MGMTEIIAMLCFWGVCIGKLESIELEKGLSYWSSSKISCTENTIYTRIDAILPSVKSYHIILVHLTYLYTAKKILFAGHYFLLILRVEQSTN